MMKEGEYLLQSLDPKFEPIRVKVAKVAGHWIYYAWDGFRPRSAGGALTRDQWSRMTPFNSETINKLDDEHYG